MQRCNSIGWLSKSSFEERWMQLLGVINQAMPSLEDIDMETFQANCINISAGKLILILLISIFFSQHPHYHDQNSKSNIITIFRCTLNITVS